MINNQN